jgi:TolA-binding protein
MDARFRADTQETLRQIREDTRGMSNRLESGARQPARQPARHDAEPVPQAAAETRPDDQQLAMADKDFNQGNFSGAVDAADNLIRYFPDSANIPEALYIKGRALYAQKSYAKAQESFQRLCDKYPSSQRFRASRLNIGRCQVSAGNTLAAIATLEEIVKSWPSSPEARSANDLLQDLKSDG